MSLRDSTMPKNHHFRILHWLIALSFTVAYLSGDDAGAMHLWFGYALAALVGLRILFALSRRRGFPSLLPRRAAALSPSAPLVGRLLMSSVLIGSMLAIASGIAMVDNTKAVGLAISPVITTAQADDDGDDGEIENSFAHHGLGQDAGPLRSLHEFAASGTLLLVGLHLVWLLMYRRQAVIVMLGGANSLVSQARVQVNEAETDR